MLSTDDITLAMSLLKATQEQQSTESNALPDMLEGGTTMQYHKIVNCCAVMCNDEDISATVQYRAKCAVLSVSSSVLYRAQRDHGLIHDEDSEIFLDS